jgi:hypothetical protein
MTIASWDDGYGQEAARAPLSKLKLATPAMLLAVSFIMPPETSIALGSLRLSPYRVILLFTVLPNLIHLLSGKAGRFNGVDMAVIGHSIWCIIALGAYGGPGMALESGGIYFVEAVGAYAMGRRYVRNPDDFYALSKVLAIVVCSLLAVALPESVLHNHFPREIFRAVLGGPGLPVIEPRWGLSRAFGTFEHPILFGVFCSMPFAMAFFVVRPRLARFRAAAMMAALLMASFVSLSAGAWLMVGLQLALAGWDYFTRGLPGRWMLLFGLFISVLVVVSSFSNRSPVKVFISYASFSAQSSYNRILIWEYGTAEVARHPIMGLGLGDWIRAPWMSASMDNFWLVVAVRYGLPALVLLVLSLAIIIFKATRQRNVDPQWVACRMAWICTIAATALASCTVHLWNNTFGFFMFLIGAGAWLVEKASKDPSPFGDEDDAIDDFQEGEAHERPRHY